MEFSEKQAFITRFSFTVSSTPIVSISFNQRGWDAEECRRNPIRLPLRMLWMIWWLLWAAVQQHSISRSYKALWGGTEPVWNPSKYTVMSAKCISRALCKVREEQRARWNPWLKVQQGSNTSVSQLLTKCLNWQSDWSIQTWRLRFFHGDFLMLHVMCNYNSN